MSTIDFESEPEEAPSKPEDIPLLRSRVPPEGGDVELSEQLRVRPVSPTHSVPSVATTPLSPIQSPSQISHTRVSCYRGTARMSVCTQPTLSPGYSARLTEAAAMSPTSFHKRYRPTFEPAFSLSPPTLPLRKLYKGTSELILDTDDDEEEESDPEEDESDIESESAELHSDEFGSQGIEVGLHSDEFGSQGIEVGLQSAEIGLQGTEIGFEST